MPLSPALRRSQGSGSDRDEFDHVGEALAELNASTRRIEYLAAQLATGRHPRRDRGTDMATQLTLVAA